jgi:hypothetical protein
MILTSSVDRWLGGRDIAMLAAIHAMNKGFGELTAPAEPV